jgi:hypothetical protein
MNQDQKYFWFGLVVILSFATLLFMLPAYSHDPARPDLDEWYSNLHRQGMAHCCDKTDCHRTDAELRDGKWWARLGDPVYSNDANTGALLGTNWNLGPYVLIPDDVIVKDENGKAIANPEGEAVICHQVLHTINKLPNWKDENVYCFVPGPEG